ncbi:hypothetical protein [Thermoanaerobacterium thermosaccharolyticum]|uniref:hypothetical protein n=1 Tax=Thermoanaerobacterium thermosaccharolyticum TaxID=1517 RepID=UPI001780D6E9|nr:hypothetical protein [Thermoanaerobacterium thermosaccharolyticum]MBE0069867.1 hypothetical protein [Thermoanaerobacterium thermosaccharolyticum]MBE0227468.1 hypothetical protein [Thermoanaerobacterium thermosaccharolyticum]
MLTNIKNKVVKFISDRKGSDVVTVVAIIAFAVAVILFALPTTREAIVNFVSNVMSKLTSTAVGN